MKASWSVGALRAALLAGAIACGGPKASPAAPLPASSAAPAVVADTADGPVDRAVADATKAYLDLLVELYPERATEMGIHTRDAELNDRSAAGFAHQMDREKEMLAALRARFAETPKSKAARTDLAILTHALSVSIAVKREERTIERRPDVYAAPLSSIFLMMARPFAPAAERATNVLARMEKLPAVLAAAKANLKNPPKVWTQVGIDRAAGAASFFDEVKPFLLTSLPQEKPRIEATLKLVRDAFADYKSFLEKDVLPRSNGDYAAGKDLFNYLLRENYFLDDDADTIRELGLRMLAQTQTQMTEVAKRIDPKAKGWPDVVAQVKKHHPKAPELLGAYRKEVARAREFLVQKDAVSFPPGDDLDVLETPPFLRSTIQAAYDQPPPFDEGTKGFFFVTPVDKSWNATRQEEWLRENDWGDIVDTAVHEAYPGHHLQLSWARRHPSLIRKITEADIFSEGWALYSEELMAELGYYDDEKRLMQLEWTLVRAARIVIDVGLHTRGMSIDDAVKILTDEVHLEKQLAVNEVKRYSFSPTQPLAYLTGREMIFKMREEYKKREGDRFTLKRFHTEVLSRGTIAPGLIAREMFGSGG